MRDIIRWMDNGTYSTESTDSVRSLGTSQVNNAKIAHNAPYSFSFLRVPFMPWPRPDVPTTIVAYWRSEREQEQRMHCEQMKIRRKLFLMNYLISGIICGCADLMICNRDPRLLCSFLQQIGTFIVIRRHPLCLGDDLIHRVALCDVLPRQRRT